jgi:hypothetical protein
MKIPEPEITLAGLIDQHHAKTQEPPRPHMGCSILGHPCDRYLWLSFRWAVIEKFDGRILRLFRRGQLEESTILQDLRAVGVKVSDRQSSVDFGWHISGSVDGIITAGVPEAPLKYHVLECKTHSKKSFDDLQKNGVEKSKPQHYIQMQLYMLGLKIDRALYYAICKDNDEIYTERVRLNKELAQKYIDRGKRLVQFDRMPEPMSVDPSWYICKMCAAHEFCHKSHTTKEVNCRTCCHATATEQSTWTCAKHDDSEIPVEFQRTGCESHLLHPDLVPWKILNHTENELTFEIDGKPVRNGEPDAYVFSSREILANPSACANPDNTSEAIRDVLNGRVVG